MYLGTLSVRTFYYEGRNVQMELTFGMVFITAALVSYTIAVWGEQITKELKPGFVVLFCIGVFCDTTGTLLMTLIESVAILGIFHAASDREGWFDRSP